MKIETILPKSSRNQLLKLKLKLVRMEKTQRAARKLKVKK